MMSGDQAPASGHRTLPHTADVIVEAWAPARVACFEEAVRALVESFAGVEDVASTEPVPIMIEPASDEEMLVALLEEAVYVLDVFGAVPVNVALEDTEEGGLAGFFDVAAVSRVHVVGAVPKAVSRSDLSIVHDGARWTCRATIDV